MYSIVDRSIYKHYTYEGGNFFSSTFYGVTNKSYISFVFNSNSSLVKNFNTINYEGNYGWEVDSIDTVSDQALPINKALGWSDSSSMSLDIMQNQLFSNNFKRKEDKYFANIANNTTSEPGSIRMGDSSSGVKGFFAKVEMSIDGEILGSHELFAVSTSYSESSY
tara:strand:+ start:130 stop:624 length:495 start_codon:yes stop_codon:yes gene_type:complete